MAHRFKLKSSFDPAAYHGMILHLRRSASTDQRAILRRLAELQYTRNDLELRRGTFRARGDVIDIFPAESERLAIRLELYGDEIEGLAEFNPLTGEAVTALTRSTLCSNTHCAPPWDLRKLTECRGRENRMGRSMSYYTMTIGRETFVAVVGVPVGHSRAHDGTCGGPIPGASSSCQGFRSARP